MRDMSATGKLPLAVCLLMSLIQQPALARDMTVLGVTLGTRFLVPACGPGERVFPARLCFDSALFSRKPWGADEYHVLMPSAGTPPYVRGELRVYAVNGIVESVQVSTWGIEAQHGVLDALGKKYGKPARARQEKQKGLRSRFPTQFAEWDFRDFTVRFDGTTGSIDWGRIEVSTRRYQNLLDDFAKRKLPAPSK